MSAIDLPSYFSGGWDRNGQSMRRCPGPLHDRGDRSPSLSIKMGDNGAWLLHCHVGCEPADILGAVGLSFSDIFADRPEPSRGAGRSQHRLSARDALQIVKHETTVCTSIMGRLPNGDDVHRDDIERATEAHRRLMRVIGGVHGV